LHPATTKNQNNRNFNIKKQLATSGQGVGQRNSNAGNMNNGMHNNGMHNQNQHPPVQTIQNITSYHIEMPKQIMLNSDDVRSLDRIMDQQNQQDSMIIQKRPGYLIN
jgi:hypothetical protein